MFDSIRKKATRFAIGLSCGSTARGVDAALVRIKGSGPKLHLKFIRSKHFPYPTGLHTRLIVARKDAREVALLNFEVGDFLAEAAIEMNRLAQADLSEVDFIASTGYTLSHNPPRGRDLAVGILQIGESAVIAERTGHPVVSDFAAGDLAAGGQGGPLCAYADWVLFAREDRTIARVHLGGITTISVIPPKFEDMIAFDAGPGMIVLDGAIRQLTSGTQDMDQKGAAAARGVVVDEFLEFLLDHPYFAKVPPKITSREEFSPETYLRDALISRKDHSLDDLVATATAAVSYCVVRAYNRFVKPQFNVSRVIISGGGTKNQALLQRLKNGIPDAVIRSSDEYGLPADSLDAIGVTVLGNETLCGKPSNVPHATGAQRPVVLGRITPA